MAELIVQAGVEYAAGLAHDNDPVRPVIEFVWNAIDAEATEISVSLPAQGGRLGSPRAVRGGAG